MVTGTCYVVARPLRERARHPGMRICSKGAVLIADADGERHLMPALRWQNYRGNKFHRIAKATISSMARIVRRPIQFIPQLAPLIAFTFILRDGSLKIGLRIFQFAEL